MDVCVILDPKSNTEPKSIFETTFITENKRQKTSCHKQVIILILMPHSVVRQQFPYLQSVLSLIWFGKKKKKKKV